MTNEVSAQKQIQYVLDLLQQEGIKVSLPVKSGYSYQSDISEKSEKAKILVYFGAKGVKTVMQGSKSLVKRAEEIVFGGRLFAAEAEEIAEPADYIGTDESGKGDYFGPLVIAGVLVDPAVSQNLKKIGVKDSKLFSENGITGLAGEIKKMAAGRFSIVFISPAKYNELYEKFGNLNKLLAWGHARAIENLLGKHQAGTAVSDRFGDESLIRNSLLEKGKKIDLYQYHKGEKYTAVAAASILARNEVNRWFIMQSKKYDMKLPKGASDLVDKAAAGLVKKYGTDVLRDAAKVHFKTTKKFLD